MVDVVQPVGGSGSGAAPSAGGGAPSRRIQPPRGLPGGRAVVGALLVAGAAVATFAAYLDASAAPSTSFVVATAEVEPGTRLTSMDEVSSRFGTIALELGGEVSDRLIPAQAVDELVGRVIVAPLQPGDLLSRSQLVADGGVEQVQTLSFSLPRNAAVGGALQAGERIDVLATFGSGDSAYTSFVVRGVPLLRVTAPDGGTAGSGSELTLTVAVTELVDIQALGHAVNTASVFVTRSTAGTDGRDAAPGAYRATPLEQGPVPDPAGIPTGDVAPAQPPLTGDDSEAGEG